MSESNVTESASESSQGGGGPINPIQMFKPYAYMLIMVGLLLVIGARGCEVMAGHSARSTANEYTLAVAEFDNDASSNEASINSRIEALEEKEEKSADDNTAISDLQKKLNEMHDENRKEKRKLAATDWRELQHDARVASASLDSSRWRYAAMFLLGSLVLMAGLVTVGFTGTGAERMVCLIMIAIITLALYGGSMSIRAG
jgi:hypothetical protein